MTSYSPVKTPRAAIALLLKLALHPRTRFSFPVIRYTLYPISYQGLLGLRMKRTHTQTKTYKEAMVNSFKHNTNHTNNSHE